MTWEIWQIFTRAHESFKIGTLMASFCLKLKIYELKIYRGVMCYDNEEWCNNLRGIDLSVQSWWGIWRVLTWALKNLKYLHFNGLLLTKAYNVWAKKVQRSFVWWYWTLMQNLKENWFVLSKMTWGISQICIGWNKLIPDLKKRFTHV